MNRLSQMCRIRIQAIKALVVYILNRASVKIMEASPLERPTDCVLLQLQSLAEIKWIHGGCVCLHVNGVLCVCFGKKKKKIKKKTSIVFRASEQTTWNLQSFNETSQTGYSGRSIHNMQQQLTCSKTQRLHPHQYNIVMAVPFSSKCLACASSSASKPSHNKAKPNRPVINDQNATKSYSFPLQISLWLRFFLCVSWDMRLQSREKWELLQRKDQNFPPHWDSPFLISPDWIQKIRYTFCSAGCTLH